MARPPVALTLTFPKTFPKAAWPPLTTTPSNLERSLAPSPPCPLPFFPCRGGGAVVNISINISAVPFCTPHCPHSSSNSSKSLGRILKQGKMDRDPSPRALKRCPALERRFLDSLPTDRLQPDSIPSGSTEQPTDNKQDLARPQRDAEAASADDELMNLKKYGPPETVSTTPERLTEAGLTLEQLSNPIIATVINDSLERAKSQRAERLERAMTGRRTADNFRLEAEAVKKRELLGPVDGPVDEDKGVARPTEVVDKGKAAERPLRAVDKGKGVDRGPRATTPSPPHALRATSNQTDAPDLHVPVPVPVQGHAPPRHAYPGAEPEPEVTTVGGLMRPTPAARPEAAEAALPNRRDQIQADHNAQHGAVCQSDEALRPSDLVGRLSRIKRALQKLVFAKDECVFTLLPRHSPFPYKGLC